MSHTPPSRYGVLVPLKPAAYAKSRLGGLGEDTRRALVSAFAADTVSAALSSSAVDTVMVVTDDHRLAAGLSAMGAEVLPDGASGDLNAALIQAAAALARRWPELAVAALCADLPALGTRELTLALEYAGQWDAALVADTEGIGTTLLTATSTQTFIPRFGPASRDAHVAAGAHEITEVDVPTLRRDVDTPADLVAALEMGVGPRTSMVATGLRLATMQATVSSFDPATGAGTVLLDDGVELPFTSEAFLQSSLRLLRAGQRVRVETSATDANAVVRRLQILTLP